MSFRLSNQASDSSPHVPTRHNQLYDIQTNIASSSHTCCIQTTVHALTETGLHLNWLTLFMQSVTQPSRNTTTCMLRYRSGMYLTMTPRPTSITSTYTVKIYVYIYNRKRMGLGEADAKRQMNLPSTAVAHTAMSKAFNRLRLSTPIIVAKTTDNMSLSL